MIVRMSNVDIVGEKHLLQDVLGLLREMGILQIDPSRTGLTEECGAESVRSFCPDQETVHERAYLEGLRSRIDKLLSLMPRTEVRQSYIEPRAVIDTIARAVERHVADAEEMLKQREAAERELADLERYAVFLKAIAPLVVSVAGTPDLDFIGMTIREPALVEQVRDALSRITDWKFSLTTHPAEDGTVVGLIVAERTLSERIRRYLSDEQVPELQAPADMGGLAYPEKVAAVERRRRSVSLMMQTTDRERVRFGQRWGPLYRRVNEWINERLTLLDATAAAFETRMCFVIQGWMQTRDLGRVRDRLRESFGGAVQVSEKEIREFDRVPIVLRNPAFFRPYELFTRILPLPSYTSFDPTPFIAIFFPVFFGMILGDAGYGLVLLVGAAVLLRKAGRDGPLRDAAQIVRTAALYAVVFGLLFGEFFGDLPERLLHITPLCVERREAIVPMSLFALAVGTAHVVLGLVFGVIAGFRTRKPKEAVTRLLDIVIILCLIAVLASYFDLLPMLRARPVILVILFLTPLLFFTGGLLAPLELLKSIGNIISYIRIMAIGLTSVLLAFVANQLGGAAGDIVVGIVVAGLLHLLNIVLGIFSPTIHALRLHYVEFFSKFMEHGGRRFEPLRR